MHDTYFLSTIHNNWNSRLSLQQNMHDISNPMNVKEIEKEEQEED